VETPGNEGLPTSKTDSKGKEEINIWLTARRLFQFGRRLIQDFELHLESRTLFLLLFFSSWGYFLERSKGLERRQQMKPSGNPF
jgi:hypothetical protein